MEPFDKLPLALRALSDSVQLDSAERMRLAEHLKRGGHSSRELASKAKTSTFSAQQALRGSWCGYGVAKRIAAALGFDLFKVVSAGGQGPYCVRDARGDLWIVTKAETE